MTKMIENAAASFAPIAWADFKAEAEKRGYEPHVYSATQFILKTANGIRCEFMNSRGGKLGFGYGNAPKKVQALFDHFSANPGSNPVVDSYTPNKAQPASNERRTMFTLKATDIKAFFDIVDFVAKFEFPVTVPAARKTTEKAVAPVKVAAPKAETKAIERAKTVEEMADIAAQAQARFAKKTGKAF